MAVQGKPPDEAIETLAWEREQLGDLGCPRLRILTWDEMNAALEPYRHRQKKDAS